MNWEDKKVLVTGGRISIPLRLANGSLDSDCKVYIPDNFPRTGGK